LILDTKKAISVVICPKGAFAIKNNSFLYSELFIETATAFF
jgi:hypothetical protein